MVASAGGGITAEVLMPVEMIEAKEWTEESPEVEMGQPIDFLCCWPVA